jgi:hypothetical protein
LQSANGLDGQLPQLHQLRGGDQGVQEASVAGHDLRAHHAEAWEKEVMTISKDAELIALSALASIGSWGSCEGCGMPATRVGSMVVDGSTKAGQFVLCDECKMPGPDMLNDYIRSMQGLVFKGIELRYAKLARRFTALLKGE